MLIAVEPEKITCPLLSETPVPATLVGVIFHNPAWLSCAAVSGVYAVNVGGVGIVLLS